MRGHHTKVQGFWNRINDVILKSGLSKSEIARRCGFSRNVLASSNLNQMMSAGILAKFCKGMNISADYILGLSDKKELKK